MGALSATPTPSYPVEDFRYAANTYRAAICSRPSPKPSSYVHIQTLLEHDVESASKTPNSDALLSSLSSPPTIFQRRHDILRMPILHQEPRRDRRAPALDLMLSDRLMISHAFQTARRYCRVQLCSSRSVRELTPRSQTRLSCGRACRRRRRRRAWRRGGSGHLCAWRGVGRAGGPRARPQYRRR